MMKAFLFLGAFLLLLQQCSGARLATLGVTNGRLFPCPGSPNCVSSQSLDESHSVSPIIYAGKRIDAYGKIISVIQSMDRARIVAATDDYIHVEFTSRLFGFVDDVEFYFDDQSKVIHLRSASRAGYYDFGVNRKRVETIRKKFSALLDP